MSRKSENAVIYDNWMRTLRERVARERKSPAKEKLKCELVGTVMGTSCFGRHLGTMTAMLAVDRSFQSLILNKAHTLDIPIPIDFCKLKFHTKIKVTIETIE